ncbi:MAG: MBL fold metallo-hydrolase [Archangiaceae bacterium]|nr:MBL fold metallo-hydrolase [Archangiaceae bacterium]
MLVTWLGHAQLYLNAAGRTLLLDPWFVEPVFGGAWFRYPPPPYPDSSSVPRPDFVLLSHTHPDHSGPQTLERLSADSTLVAMPFPSGAMQRRLAKSHLKKVQWLEPWQTRELSPGLKLTFVPHDRGWEVSSMVLEADGVRLYHGNDNVLTVEAYRQIVDRLGKIDLAFLPFAGASSYPTGFDGTREELLERCAKKKAEGLQRFLEGIEGLQPAEAAPFASSWALLEPGELWKNFIDRPTPAEALKAAIEPAARQGTHLLHLEPGDQWSPETGAIAKGLTEGWGYDAASVERYAETQRERVAKAITAARGLSKRVSAETLDAAFREYFTELLEKTKAGTAQLRMKAGFQAEGGAGAWRVTFVPGQAPVLERGLSGDEDEVLTLTAGELWALLTSPANWEDVWYGYRLKVHKRPGAGYYRAFWEMLLNFDAEGLSARLQQKYA